MANELTRLDLVKTLITLKLLKVKLVNQEIPDLVGKEQNLKLDELNRFKTGLVLSIDDVDTYITEIFGISLSQPFTTPKKLYGKSYKELSHEELLEYSQIKRIIRRYKDGLQK